MRLCICLAILSSLTAIVCGITSAVAWQLFEERLQTVIGLPPDPAILQQKWIPPEKQPEAGDPPVNQFEISPEGRTVPIDSDLRRIREEADGYWVFSIYAQQGAIYAALLGVALVVLGFGYRILMWCIIPKVRK